MLFCVHKRTKATTINNVCRLFVCPWNIFHDVKKKRNIYTHTLNEDNPFCFSYCQPFTFNSFMFVPSQITHSRGLIKISYLHFFGSYFLLTFFFLCFNLLSVKKACLEENYAKIYHARKLYQQYIWTFCLDAPTKKKELRHFTFYLNCLLNFKRHICLF